MATLNQISYDLLSLIRGGQLADSELINIEQVKFWVINTRALLIRQDQAKGRSISDNILQTLPCVPLTNASASECCEITSNCTIKRTVSTIPNAVEVPSYDMLERVAGVDILTKGISILPYQRALYHGNSRWTSGLPACFFKNGYLYFLNVPANLKMVSIQMVMEDPREAEAFKSCAGESCYSDDDQFPISAWMIEVMTKMVLDGKFKVAAHAPTDQTGDQLHNVQ